MGNGPYHQPGNAQTAQGGSVVSLARLSDLLELRKFQRRRGASRRTSVETAEAVLVVLEGR